MFSGLTPGVAIAVEDAVILLAMDNAYPDLRIVERITSNRLAVAQIVYFIPKKGPRFSNPASEAKSETPLPRYVPCCRSSKAKPQSQGGRFAGLVCFDPTRVRREPSWLHACSQKSDRAHYLSSLPPAVTTPSVISPGDLRHIVVTQFTVNPVHQRSHLAGVNEERFSSPVAESSVLLVAGAVLVYDVSRWGRFQDSDESAFYEFVCKSAGVRVHYCAEAFPWRHGNRTPRGVNLGGF